MLRRLGCQTDLASNGNAAVAMHETHRYDLLLMDCQMPELDGYEATTKIRLSEITGEHVPIIALTAHAIQGEKEKCLAAGMDDYMSKPIRLQVLQEVLGRWLTDQKEKEQNDSGRVTPAADQDDHMKAVQHFFGSDFPEIAMLFQTDTPKRIRALHDAVDDWSRLAQLAHTLSGSCASMGAKKLSMLCQELELEAKNGLSAQKAQARLKLIAAEYDAVSRKLQSMLLTA
jgi:CheY-like chemotaxis protein/HPt (histidine-containing phosphotransfer) domain-containing protein